MDDEEPVIYRQDSRRVFFTSLAAQGGALLVSKALVAPIDRLRLLRQLSLASGPGWHWTGCGTHLAQVSVSNAIRLLLVIQSGDRDSFFVNWGICTAAVALTYPLDVRYTQRISGIGVLPGNFFQRNYRGIRYSLATTPIFLGTALSSVSLMKTYFAEDANKFPGNVASGATAGLIAGAVTYPLDTLRKREMMGMGRPVGFRQLFAGFGLHLMKVIPEYCVLATTYSYLVHLRYF